MEDQLEQAIEIAAGGTRDPALKQQAIDYCSQIKDSEDGWQSCLNLFTGEKRRSDTTRFFSLQVLDNALNRLDREKLGYVRNQLFNYYRCLSPDIMEPAFIRNKLGQTFSYLFVLTYAESWTSFFDDIFALMGISDNSNNPQIGNPLAVDMYLRVLRSIHEEIGDNLIARPKIITDRNNVLKDLIRQRSVEKIAASWTTILYYFAENNVRPEGLQKEVIEGTLRVIGTWVSWIDITLVVTPQLLTFIFSLLGNADHRLSACDALCEIVLKKMSPRDKVELLVLLSPSRILYQLPSDSSDLEFEERVAKLTNIIALELVHILDGSTGISSGTSASEKDMEQSQRLLLELMPIILQHLANEYDDTSVQVLPSISEYLNHVRREVKKSKDKIDVSTLTKNSFGQATNFPPDSNFIDQQTSSLLNELLKNVILKMKYDDSAEWSNGQEESDVDFLDLRGKLKVIQDQVAAIDSVLYSDGMAYVITNSLEGSTSKKWQQVELGLYELTAFGESLKNNSIPSIRGVESYASKKFHELFIKMVNSNVVAINHPSIQLLYIELINRNSAVFTASQPELLRRVLEIYVSPLGIHNTDKRVQVRAWYLFFKFVKASRSLLGDISENIFNSLEPLLKIKAEVPTTSNADDSSEMSADGANEEGHFENQLYLFELCGVLFYSTPNQDVGYTLTQRLLQPIYADIEYCLGQNFIQDVQVSLQVHHNMMAIGTFARGFESSRTSIAQQSTKKAAQELKNSAQAVITVLERMQKLEVIRDASRFAFAGLISLLGVEILNETTRLISVLLNETKITEFSDFLGFLGQLVHTFRSEIGVFEMFSSLIQPLIERCLMLLKECDNEASTGSTDANFLKRDLRRAYLQFLFNVFNNNLSAIFITENNRQAFEAMTQSVLHYAGDLFDSQSQKSAIVVLSKMLVVWGEGEVMADSSSGSVPSSNNTSGASEIFGKGMKVSGFDNQFIFEQYTRVCWELPAKQGFSIRDAQIRIIVGELALLQKSVAERKGDIYYTYLAERYFPAIGLPANLVQEYVSHLSRLSGKDFKKFLVDFIARVSQ